MTNYFKRFQSLRSLARMGLAFAPAFYVVLGSVAVTANGAMAAESGATQVQTLSLQELALYPERTSAATVVSLNESTISAQITATVRQVNVKVGDQVANGDSLVTLDCTDYDLALSSAEAALAGATARIELARLSFERTEQLKSKKLASVQELDASRADLKGTQADKRAAQVAVQQARVNQSRCQVTSPLDALVVARHASVGQLANLGTALVDLLDLESIEVSAEVFAPDAKLLKQADPILFTYAGETIALKLRDLLPAINSNTRSREARLVFESERALPGAAGKIVWHDVRPHIAPAYVVERNRQMGVFVIEQGIARFVAIAGAQSGRANPLDLPLSAQIVVQGQYSLKQGEAVAVDSAVTRGSSARAASGKGISSKDSSAKNPSNKSSSKASSLKKVSNR